MTSTSTGTPEIAASTADPAGSRTGSPISRPIRLPIAAALAGLLLATLPLLILTIGADTTAPHCNDTGTPPAADAQAPIPAWGDLTSRQLQNAATIVRVGRDRHIPPRGIVVALAAALQESRLRIYANDGLGGDLAPDQHGIAASMRRLPHEAVGTDHGSLGLFQQQWPWWGTMRDLMNPAASAAKFYTALLAVPHWRTLPVTLAAQAVQHSSHPGAYADDEPLARRLLAGGLGSGGTTAAVSGTMPALDCPATSTGAGGGTVVFPLPPGSRYVDEHNFGHRGGRWASRHTGTDLAVPCGTPVLAATAGTVRIDRHQSWAGPWLVKISTGPGRLATWYAHMQRLLTHDDQYVASGQHIGDVGSLGNATGCHLHFEVHPHGGSIYQDPIDPSGWLATHVGHPLTGIAGAAEVAGSTGADASEPAVRVATLNILGASHTAAGGTHASWPSGRRRAASAIALLERWVVDVAALQEVQPAQRTMLLTASHLRLAMFPDPSRGGDNRIIWQRDRFRLLAATTFTLPYFDGHAARQPAVLLRRRGTSQTAWFLSVHNPADTTRFHHQARYRRRAVARERAVVERFAQQGATVFLMGDFNATHQAFCPLTTGGLITSATGPRRSRSCHLPSRSGIDWIFATSDVTFDGYSTDASPVHRHVSDHALRIADATW